MIQNETVIQGRSACTTKLIALTRRIGFWEAHSFWSRREPVTILTESARESGKLSRINLLSCNFPRTVLESAVIFERCRTMPSVKKMLAERDVIRDPRFRLRTGGESGIPHRALNWSCPVEAHAATSMERGRPRHDAGHRPVPRQVDFDLRVRTVTHKAEKSGFAPANVKPRDDYDAPVTSSVSASSTPVANAVPRLRVRVFRQHRSQGSL